MSKEKADRLRTQAAAAEQAARMTDDFTQYSREMRKAADLRQQADRLDPPVRMHRPPASRCAVCGITGNGGGWKHDPGISLSLCPGHAHHTTASLRAMAEEARAAGDPAWKRYRHAANRFQAEGQYGTIRRKLAGITT